MCVATVELVVSHPCIACLEPQPRHENVPVADPSLFSSPATINSGAVTFSNIDRAVWSAGELHDQAGSGQAVSPLHASGENMIINGLQLLPQT